LGKTIIEGNEAAIYSDKVAEPVAVQYAWADNPECNLIHSDGLPAIPFRTDDWKGITQNKIKVQQHYNNSNFRLLIKEVLKCLNECMLLHK
jgi:hypothetical protein